MVGLLQSGIGILIWINYKFHLTVKFVTTHCPHFQRKFELRTLYRRVFVICIKIVFNTLIIHYKTIDYVSTHYTTSIIDNGTYQWGGEVCLYVDKQTSCCSILTLHRKRLWWRRNSGRMVCSSSLVLGR